MGRKRATRFDPNIFLTKVDGGKKFYSPSAVSAPEQRQTALCINFSNMSNFDQFAMEFSGSICSYSRGRSKSSGVLYCGASLSNDSVFPFPSCLIVLRCSSLLGSSILLNLSRSCAAGLKTEHALFSGLIVRFTVLVPPKTPGTRNCQTRSVIALTVKPCARLAKGVACNVSDVWRSTCWYF
jgi:hypothetical protein